MHTIKSYWVPQFLVKYNWDMNRNHSIDEAEDAFASLPIDQKFISHGEDIAFCDDAMTLLYACIGQAKIEMADGIQVLPEDAVALIDRMTPARVTSIEGEVLMMQIDPVYFDQYEKGFSLLHIRSSIFTDNTSPYQYLMASIMQHMESGSPEARLKIEKELMELALCLKQIEREEGPALSGARENEVNETEAK